MKPAFRKFLNFVFLFFTFGIVLYIGLNGNDIGDLANALSTLSPAYLLLCLLSWALYVFFDALSVHFFLRRQGYAIRFRSSLHSAIIGIYYSNVTPGATGGQPMQIYTLSKSKIPIGVSASAMAIKFIVFQVMLLLLGLVLWVAHGAFFAQYAAGSEWFVLLGYAANLVTISAVVLMAVCPSLVRWVIKFCIKIGVKLRIVKNPEHSAMKWESNCQSFLSSIQLIIRHPKDVLAQCGIAVLQLMSLMLTIVAIYHAYSLSGVSDIQLVTMGVLLYIGASYTPLPGASGAQEGGFAVLFSKIFPPAKLFVALLLWRFATYYLSVLVGAVVTTVGSVRGIRGAGKAGESPESVAEK